MIHNIEFKLKEYCRTQDSKYFEDNCYEYFNILAAFICKKYGVLSKDIPDTIQDLVAHASVKLPEKYDALKGTAKATCIVIMSHYMNDKIRHDNCGKRNRKLLLFIEEMSDAYTSDLICIEVDLFELDKKTLLERKEIFDVFEKTLHKRICAMILTAIEHPEQFKDVRGSFTKDIAKKTYATVDEVYTVIKKMRKVVEEHGFDR